MGTFRPSWQGAAGQRRASWILSFVLLAAFGCGGSRITPLTGSSCQSQLSERLFFGLESPDGPVSDAAWEAFLAREVTPRFPAGLTVVDAGGQWRGADGAVDREASRVVEIVHEDSAEATAAVAAIVASYRREFQQEAVLVIRQQVLACL